MSNVLTGSDNTHNGATNLKFDNEKWVEKNHKHKKSTKNSKSPEGMEKISVCTYKKTKMRPSRIFPIKLYDTKARKLISHNCANFFSAAKQANSRFGKKLKEKADELRQGASVHWVRFERICSHFVCYFQWTRPTAPRTITIWPRGEERLDETGPHQRRP